MTFSILDYLWLLFVSLISIGIIIVTIVRHREHSKAMAKLNYLAPPNTTLCGAANESTNAGAPQNSERTPSVETKSEQAASAEANVRQELP